VVVPSVAELPTCQNTLHWDPPLTMRTLEALAVVSVLPILKMKTALGLPGRERQGSRQLSRGGKIIDARDQRWNCTQICTR
jgi:hypothetical protein